MIGEGLSGNLHLGLSLAKTQFKLRNEGSYLGALWFLLEPMLLFTIIILVKGYIKGGDRPGYPVYLLTGIMMFNFFRSATGGAANIIGSNAAFVKNMRISTGSLVLSRILQAVFSHCFEIAVLAGFLVLFGYNVMWVALYPLVFIFLLGFTAGISFVLATAGAYVSDVGNAWAVILRILWFATPILYYSRPGTAIEKINMLNPLSHYIKAGRLLLMEGRLPAPGALLLMALLGLVTLGAGSLIFNRYKTRFAELV